MFVRFCSSTVIAVLLCHPLPAVAVDTESAFNPALSLILSGSFGYLQRDPALPATGFAMNPNPGHAQGFNLGESELGISANIDPMFRGVSALALAPGGGVSVENAFVQTTALGEGLNFKFGRYFSGFGYLNEQHAHAWDFVDQPLVYAALWNNQLGEDGVQFKWLAPTERFIELGSEIGKGRGYPGSDTPQNGSGASVLFLHTGDDISFENNWRAGISLHRTQATDRVSAMSNGIKNSFTGSSQTVGYDFVWKYAPNGNVRSNSFKFQAEYFRRSESGSLTYDTAGVNVTDRYAVSPRGWYAQGVHQFAPRWRTGVRYDKMDAGVASVGALNAANVVADYGYSPVRISVMLDYSPSEFSRLRVQLARDKSRQGLQDYQLFMQYVMSMGAHGAHSY